MTTIAGQGRPGTPLAGVVTVQGDAAGTPIPVTVAGSTSSPATAAVTTVAQNAASVSLIAANPDRKALEIWNAPAAAEALYIKLGGAASIAAGGYTAVINKNTLYELPLTEEGVYTGAIFGIWSGAGAGYANITEVEP